jgi:hypothetical protein
MPGNLRGIGVRRLQLALEPCTAFMSITTYAQSTSFLGSYRDQQSQR